MKFYRVILVVGVIALGFALVIFSRGETTPAVIPTVTPTTTPKPRPTVTPTETAVTHNPTFAEMIAFLNGNKVNWQEYRDDYDCLNFACELQRDAIENGIRCAFVGIDYPVDGHALVAFETTDKGLIYIEPQLDLPVKIEVGTKYTTWFYGFYNAIDHDDTVTKITLKWDPSFCRELFDIKGALSKRWDNTP